MAGNNQGHTSLIAVMGVTGAGKSTLVRRITGCDAVEVGHSLSSSEPQSFLFEGFSR